MMKKKTDYDFFDISSNIEELPENELFTLKGGYSDVAWENEIEPVDVYPPDNDDNNSPGEDNDSDDQWYNDDNNGSDGGGTGGSSGSDIGDPNHGVSTLDPFKRNINGDIIVRSTGETTHNTDYPGVTLILDQVALQLKNGQEIIAYKTAMVYDHNTQENRPPTEAEKSNCFGFAIADGEFWFYDDRSTSIDEFNSFDNVLNTFFEETSQTDAAIAVVFYDDFAYHAGVVNGDSYLAKGGVGEVHQYEGEFAFRNGEQQNGAYMDGDVKYYKYKN